MSDLKTFFCVVLLLGAVHASPVAAQSVPSDRLHFFASCAGRLSALMEYQWMFDGPASEQTKQYRAGVIDILQAMTPPDRGREVLNWRIEAKHAHAMLLSRATFNANSRVSRMAQYQAQRQIQECRAVLLG